MDISIREILHHAAVNYAESSKLWQSSGMSRNMSGWYSLEAKQATPATPLRPRNAIVAKLRHLQQSDHDQEIYLMHQGGYNM